MANTVYPKFKKRCATTGGNVLAGTVRAQLVDLAAYTYSAAHEFLSELPAGARIGAPVTLTGKTVSDEGVFDAADMTVSGLVSAPSIEALVLYVDTGDEATSPLMTIVDTATGLPIAAGATGGTVAWSNGTDRICRF